MKRLTLYFIKKNNLCSFLAPEEKKPKKLLSVTWLDFVEIPADGLAVSSL